MNTEELYSYYYSTDKSAESNTESYCIEYNKSRRCVKMLVPKWIYSDSIGYYNFSEIETDILPRTNIGSVQEYYDIVVLELKSPSERPKCEWCLTEDAKFHDLLRGYSRFCCRSHLCAYIAKHKVQSDEERTKRSESLRKAHKETPDNWKGWYQSEVARKSMSKSRSGKPKSESHRANLQKAAVERYRRMPDLMPNYGNSKKGHYTPIKSNGEEIYYLSSWELKFMKYCDESDYIASINSCKDHFVPYIKPTDGLEHTYYPDFYLTLSDGKEVIVEIKPINLLYDEVVVAKRSAANKLFSEADIIYITLTEDEVLNEDFNLEEFIISPKQY